MRPTVAYFKIPLDTNNGNFYMTSYWTTEVGVCMSGNGGRGVF